MPGKANVIQRNQVLPLFHTKFRGMYINNIIAPFFISHAHNEKSKAVNHLKE